MIKIKETEERSKEKKRKEENPLVKEEKKGVSFSYQ